MLMSLYEFEIYTVLVMFVLQAYVSSDSPQKHMDMVMEKVIQNLNTTGVWIHPLTKKNLLTAEDFADFYKNPDTSPVRNITKILIHLQQIFFIY